jgi:hypothetical protein
MVSPDFADFADFDFRANGNGRCEHLPYKASSEQAYLLRGPTR